jgi:hypothetical protein
MNVETVVEMAALVAAVMGLVDNTTLVVYVLEIMALASVLDTMDTKPLN